MSTTIYVYVPAPDAVTIIDQRAGIVGTPEGDGRIFTYYEGDRFHYANVHTFADRCAIAAGRLQESYPTSAVASIPLGDLRRVGIWTGDGIDVLPNGEAALERWLGVTGGDLHAELQLSGVRP